MTAFCRKQILMGPALGLMIFALPASAQWTSTGCSPSGSYCLTSGNVGIGTTSPVRPLNVVSSYQFGTILTSGVGASHDATLAIGTSYDSSNATSLQAFTDNGTTVNNNMVLQPFGGRVGIGTASPSTALHVSSSATDGNSPMLTLENTSGVIPGTFGPGIILNDSVAGTHGYVISQYQSPDSQFVIANLAPPWNSYLTVDQSGNMGIGTNFPQSKLAVNGTITTQEVVVTATGWSDYVFDKDHQLAPLTEVASFIKENHHLPGIPSAAEVAEKGISVGEMQSKLLAKIEELTLHVIELDERNRRLEKENESVRHEMRRLKAEGAK